jgi:uncharacterized protein (DUF2062 family)
VVFKRRDKQTYWQWIVEFVYPRKGWSRGMDYIGHRIKRLPDTPHKIAIGIACGVFVTFTPFFGLHFLLAWFLALLFRGNIFAAILATFFGNPITFPVIAATSYQLGLWILGLGHEKTVWSKIHDSFEHAFSTLWGNIKSIFGPDPSSWDGFWEFTQEVFLPYLVGGIIPGLITAGLFYAFSKPLIAGHQKRRKLKLVERRARQRRKAAKKEAS